MNNIIKIIKLLEDLNVLIEGVTEAVKHEIKKQEYKFLEALLTSFISATSNFFSSKRYKWQRSYKSRKSIYGYHFFSSTPSFKQYWDNQLFQ